MLSLPTKGKGKAPGELPQESSPVHANVHSANSKRCASNGSILYPLVLLLAAGKAAAFAFSAMHLMLCSKEQKLLELQHLMPMGMIEES